MNLAIRQTSRKPLPGQRQPSSGTGSLNGIAEAFGLDISTFGEQAESMWTMLNNLHESDPTSYDSFIQQQFKEMKQSINAKNTIVPNKGYVVKAFLMGFNDKKNDRDSRKNKQTNKLFVNFCSHKAVEVPIDTNGKKVDDETENPMNAKIPMVISNLRDFKDSSGHDAYAIDVVLNPWCLKRSSLSSLFKSQLIVLVFKSVEEERKISIHTEWKLIKSTYKGGIGQNGMDVHPFPIDEKILRQKNNCSTEEEGESRHYESVDSIMNNPQSLLHSLRKHDNNAQDDFECLQNGKEQGNSKQILIQEVNTKTKSKVNLIEEIDDKALSLNDMTSSHILEKTEVPLAEQMKGFLNKKKCKALYKEASTGDGLKGTGGRYCKFMAKCQVIDTTNLPQPPVAEPSSAQKATFTDGMKKGFLNDKNGCFLSEKSLPGSFDEEFNSIMKRADPIFEEAFNDTSKVALNVQEVDDTFQGLVDAMEVRHGNCKADRKLSQTLEQDHNLDSKNMKKIPFHTSTNKGSFGVLLNLKDTVVSTVHDINVEISRNELNVSTSCGRHLRYVHDNVNEEVKARFKRKTKMLSLNFVVKS